MLLHLYIEHFTYNFDLVFLISMADILNANPTIRNASDLPTRRRRTSSPKSKKSPLGLFANSIPSLTYLRDPFEAHAYSGSDSDDENTVEPIDEQEIYGSRSLLDVFSSYLLDRIFARKAFC